jgi:hypothetical protein
MADPAIERVAAAWRAPLDGPLQPIGVVASQTRTEQTAGFMVVSPEYFALFDIRVVRGRVFTALEADEGAPLVLVSEATARTLWPGLDPIGQTLDLVPSRGRQASRRPAHARVRVIGVTEDVVSGLLMDGVDATCVYFATGLGAQFGIRMALGATVRQIVSGILGDTLHTAAIGLGAGLAVSMSLVRFFSGTIPIIPSYSLRTYVAGTSIVLTATVIAALLPSLRAARIDPSQALRAD